MLYPPDDCLAERQGKASIHQQIGLTSDAKPIRCQKCHCCRHFQVPARLRKYDFSTQLLWFRVRIHVIDGCNRGTWSDTIHARMPLFACIPELVSVRFSILPSLLDGFHYIEGSFGDNYSCTLEILIGTAALASKKMFDGLRAR